MVSGDVLLGSGVVEAAAFFGCFKPDTTENKTKVIRRSLRTMDRFIIIYANLYVYNITINSDYFIS